MYRYLVFGLKVASEIELNCYAHKFDKSDVTITFGNEIETYVDSASFIKVSKKKIVLNFVDLGIFEVLDGNQIIIHLIKKADYNGVRLFLLSQVFACLLILRGTFPLHGSTISKDNIGLTILGSSGSGKSTLSTALMQKGWKMVTDDIISIHYENNRAHIVPSFPFQKIWEDTAQLLDIDISQSESLYKRENKYFFTEEEYFSNELVEAHYIIELNVSDDCEISYELVSKGMTLPILIDNSYRYHIVADTHQLRGHMSYISKLCNQVQCYKLMRPTRGNTINNLIAIVEEIVGIK